MSVEENKAAYHHIIEEVWNKGNLSLIESHVHPDFFWSASGLEYRGAEGFGQMVTMMREAFPDLHVTIDDMVGEGDRLVVRVTVSGTMKGTFMGIPPTGKKVSQVGITIVRIAGGKIAETWALLDQLDLMQQLGVSPPGQ